jgi:putative flippase GtrA
LAVVTTATLVVRYALFALIAGLVNLAAQRGVLAIIPGPAGLALALCIGTLTGLAVKYAFDKRWIFGDARTGIGNHGRLFSLYALMGVATTLVFWITETAFWLIWRTETMREVGAAIGLTIGYVVKYQLDRRYVFTSG